MTRYRAEYARQLRCTLIIRIESRELENTNEFRNKESQVESKYLHAARHDEPALESFTCADSEA